MAGRWNVAIYALCRIWLKCRDLRVLPGTKCLLPVGWFLLRKFDCFNFYMVSSCSILFTDFRTVFVFALGWFFTPSVFFYDLGGNLHWDDLKWPKNHFRVVKRWFWVVECKFWGHISIEKCFCFFRSDTGSAIFRVRKIAFFAFFNPFLIWGSTGWPLKCKLMGFFGHMLLSRAPPPCVVLCQGPEVNFPGHPRVTKLFCIGSPLNRSRSLTYCTYVSCSCTYLHVFILACALA